MALKAISDKERFVHVFSGDPDVKFYYRRVPGNLREEWVKTNTRMTKRNVEVTDMKAVGRALLEYSLLGWEGFEQPNSKEPFPFSIDSVDDLPAEPVEEFIDVLIKGVKTVKSDEAEKNSQTTRSSG
ncbi:MAG TPA: hypothetical protein VMV56_07585 [Williamwhitmania sp.]|nr:hypothetical protein [Williamwhitmania sp.]